MLTARRRYETKERNYLKNLYETFGTIPENHLQAIKLRQEFFRKWVLNRETTDYLTDTEKDWSYIARRVFNL